MQASDRRGNGRVPHAGSIMVRSLSSTFRRGSARDFTEEGARLVVPEDVPPGTSVVLHLKLEAQRMLSLLATVVWARPDGHSGTTEVGVRFQEGCRADRQHLANWLHCRRILASA